MNRIADDESNNKNENHIALENEDTKFRVCAAVHLIFTTSSLFDYVTFFLFSFVLRRNLQEAESRTVKERREETEIGSEAAIIETVVREMMMIIIITDVEGQNIDHVQGQGHAPRGTLASLLYSIFTWLEVYSL